MQVDINARYTDLVVRSERTWQEALLLFDRLNRNREVLSRIEEDELRSNPPPIHFMRKRKSEWRDEAIAANAERLLEIASRTALVFGHSALDAALNDFLCFCATLDGSAFDFHVQERKLPAKEFLSKSGSELRAALIDRFLKESSREPILKRISILLSICKPTAQHFSDVVYPEFVYEQSRVEQIDHLRHQVIHRGAIPSINYDDTLYLYMITRLVYRVVTSLRPVTFDLDLAIRTSTNLKS